MLLKLSIRLLAFIIDWLIVSNILIMILALLGYSFTFYRWLMMLLFFVYNSVCITILNGRTIGKYFAKIRVVTGSDNIMISGVREIVKLLYIVPYVNIVFILFNLIIYFLTGKMLQDYIGESEVLSENEYKKYIRG